MPFTSPAAVTFAALEAVSALFYARDAIEVADTWAAPASKRGMGPNVRPPAVGALNADAARWATR